MAITITSGGFDGIIKSNNTGDIELNTENKTRTITLNGLFAVTGSVILELDPQTANIRNKKEYKSDGTIEETKFTSAGVAIETTVVNPVDGKQFIRSGSVDTVANQIVLEQTTDGALISVSGSSGATGFNYIEKDTFTRLGRSNRDTFITGSSTATFGFSPKNNAGSWNWNINPNTSVSVGASTLFRVSSSGDVYIPKGK